ncbi:methyltransferase type [Seminavis robusta]|uniref:Methyltransferase type n=1 Tax=Seminavis robusta TaxID=568900 RepID=A0A9N8HNZ1_9STRA|nr:methyltransferase type [Seminavis robusta]|eukprot:Sro1270_g257980.1 methyltransferase type (377) ;mRNA; r:20603-21733
MTTETTTNNNTVEKDREAFADKVFQAVLGAQMVQTAYLGYTLGWYQALNDAEKALTPVELAKATDSSPRYAREWLEQQTIGRWIVCDNPSESNPDARQFRLPPAHAGVLTDVLALDYLMPLAVIQAGWGKDMDKLVDAYKNDTGLSWEDMTNDAREQQAAQNRPFFLNGLAKILQDSMDSATVERLQTTGGKVADIGAGYAWSSIGVAHHFPAARVDAYDVDAPSIEQANKNIALEGLEERVKAHCVDASTVVQDLNTHYDLVMALECVHDMNDPISVLKTMREMAGTDGTVIVMDERVAEDFAQANKDHDPVEQVMYGFSCMCCLPDGKSRPNSVATGTVMRPSILRMYAQQAGFREIEILPDENDFFRFYKLLK